VKQRAGEWVYSGCSNGLPSLLRCIYAALQPPSALPLSGGYMDQPAYFCEALSAFSDGHQLYKEQGSKLLDTINSLRGR